MHLYHLTQTTYTGYDTYSDCVVAAFSAEVAKTIHPSGNGRRIPEPNWPSYVADWANWPNDPSMVTAKEIGRANDDIASGVICASFHAG